MKKKMKLNDIKLNSFITELNDKSKATADGGVQNNPNPFWTKFECTYPPQCAVRWTYAGYPLSACVDYTGNALENC